MTIVRFARRRVAGDTAEGRATARTRVHHSAADATRVADRLALFALAPSLGGVESLVTQPCTTTHHEIGAAERARRGISDAMLRLSVGLEDTEDLIADLDQALRAALGR